MTASQTQATSSIDPEEVAQFSRIAAEWWDPKGKFKPLHEINPVRIGYIKQQIAQHFGKDADAIRALEGLSLLDIGCGGGLICEPMHRMGADITGIDASEENIKTARTHAEQGGLEIDYRATTAEDLLTTGAQFDVVLALEIVEHVADAESFIASCAGLVKSGGLLIMSTMNRTPQSYLKAIIGAEYVLRLLPRGTHSWQKFLRPAEMLESMQSAGLAHVHSTGMTLNPFKWQWRLDEKDLQVNYLMVAKK